MKFNNLLYKDLPVYNIVLDDDDENQGLSVVSIVSDPAVCEQLFMFDKTEKKQLMFASEENEQKCITSVAILADVPIYRIDEYGNPYYVVFQKQVIRDLVEKYSKDGYQNLVSFEHNGEIVNDFILLESYFVDKEKGIAPEKFDVSDGSWIVTYKCTNDETWEKVKNELGTGGYSIEINCEIEPAPDTQEILDEPEHEEDYDADFDWLAELIKMLEEADCEIIMQNEKKKSEQLIIEDEPDDDEGDGWDYLNFETIERSDVASQVKKAVKVDGTDFWVYGIGKDNGKDVVILYNPNKKEYELKPINEIKKWVPLKDKPGTFPALPDSIKDNDNITVQKTIISDTIPDIMHNHILAQLSYDDKQENPHKGYRQVAIVAYGYTKKGNRCFRAYELFGDSRSASEGIEPLPSWRLFLEERVDSLKAMTGTEPYSAEWLGSLSPRYNWDGDRSMNPCTDHLTQADFL